MKDGNKNSVKKRVVRDFFSGLKALLSLSVFFALSALILFLSHSVFDLPGKKPVKGKSAVELLSEIEEKLDLELGDAAGTTAESLDTDKKFTQILKEKRKANQRKSLLKKREKVALKTRSKEKEATLAIERFKKSYFNPTLLDSEYCSWGVAPKSKASIMLSDAWKIYQKEKAVQVAIIDTGIDPKHPFLKDSIIHPNTSDLQKKGRESAFGLDFSKGKANKHTPYDEHGHGTHIAGIIRCVDPGVKFLVLKYYNPKASGQDNLDSTIEALRYAVKIGVDIINYSGGGPSPSIEELRILKEAEKKGIIIVAAAGNERSNIDKGEHAYYPASYALANIISVASHDENLKLVSSSNYGAKTVDISAPGMRIKSTIPHERTSYLTGTSQATAFVTGVVSLIKSQFPRLSYLEIKEIIRKSATKSGEFSGKNASGGSLHASRALGMAYEKVMGENPLKLTAEIEKVELKRNESRIPSTLAL